MVGDWRAAGADCGNFPAFAREITAAQKRCPPELSNCPSGSDQMNDSIILEARELAFMDRVRPASSKIWHLGDELFTEAVKGYLAGVSFAKIRVMLAGAGIVETDLPSQAAWVKFWGRFKPFLR